MTGKIEEISGERDAIDAILETPIRIVLGGQEWDLSPLKLDDELEFRRALGKIAGTLVSSVVPAVNTETAQVNQGRIMELMMPALATDGIDHIMELIFAMNRKIPNDIHATPIEKIQASGRIIRLICPLLRELVAMAQALNDIA